MPRKKRLGKTGVKHLPKKRRLEEGASEEESIQDEKQETAGEADNSEVAAGEEDESSDGEAQRVAVEEHARERDALASWEQAAENFNVTFSACAICQASSFSLQ